MLGKACAVAMTLLGTLAGSVQTQEVVVQVALDRTEVEMGRCVQANVTTLTPDGRPIGGCLVLAYVNERRWGAHEVTEADGRARILLPLPNPGPARIRVQAIPGFFQTYWVWTLESKPGTAYLATAFTIAGPVDEAGLRVAVDDSCTLYLNDQEIGRATGTGEATLIADLAPMLRPGENVLAAEGRNDAGMDGLAVQLRLRAGETVRYVVTDPTWHSWRTAPEQWPQPAVAQGDRVRNGGRLIDHIHYAPHFEKWPGMVDRDQLFAGRPLSEGAIVSEPVMVEVSRRAIASRRDPDHLIGMQWGSYFVPGMFYWSNTQAVPLVGLYESWNPDVIRQHALWLMDIGVDFIFADWPIYIPPDAEGKHRWRNRGEGANQQVHVTALTLEVYAQLRDEGYPVPALVIMPFLSNGPSNTKETVNEQLEWLHDYFIRNPRYRDLWVMHDGKPLVVLLHNAGTPADQMPGPPIDETYFTVRYMAAQLQANHMERHGYWSWMDGSPEPIVTFRDGKPEVVTPHAANFGLGMWLAEDAGARRNGTTYVRSFKPAFEHRPRYVLLHQWNEFTGQMEGFGYNDNALYGDSYSVELSDDIEPVSLTADGYRGDTGGWGLYYVNLSQALVAVYKQGDQPEDTILAVCPPNHGQVVSGDSVEIRWEVAGKQPESYTILLDGRAVAEDIQGVSYMLDLSQVGAGEHVLTVEAEGAVTRYLLQRDRMNVPLEEAIPVKADVPFVVTGG